MSIFLLVLGLILFIGLVVVHEWGHFIMARHGGVEVEEFGIGFPPKAKTITKKNGTEYTLNWLPLGGFVRLKGEHDANKTEGSYGAAPLWTKVKIMAAGVVMNLVTAYILLILLALIGVPKLIDNQFTVKNNETVTRQDVFVGYIEPGSPAEKAGLKKQDVLTRYGTMACSGPEELPLCGKFDTASSLAEVTKSQPGHPLTIEYKRDGKVHKTVANLRTQSEVEASKKTNEPKGYLGVSPGEFQVNRYTWSAPVVAGGLIGQFTELTFKGLGSAISGLFAGDTAKATEQVTGPVGIFVVLQQGANLGIQFILMVIAIISLSLAIMNVLPIPALDGGRLFVTLVYRALRRKLTETAEDRIHGTGFAALMLLFVLITIVDVRRFF